MFCLNLVRAVTLMGTLPSRLSYEEVHDSYDSILLKQSFCFAGRASYSCSFNAGELVANA